MEKAVIISRIWTPLGIEATLAILPDNVQGFYLTPAGNKQEFVRPVNTELNTLQKALLSMPYA